jgi:hypothetical protein
MEDNMLKRTVLGALCVAAVLVAASAQAQENATLILRSGERVSGQLVDLGGVGFTVRVNGQERHIAQNDVAVIDFTGGTMSEADWAKFTGTSQIVLKNGQTIEGQLYDIGGTSPLKITFKTPSGDREFSSAEIGRIVLAKPNNTSAVATSGSSTGGQTINVSARQQWTPTGMYVQKGQTLTFTSSGEVRLSANSNDVATVDGSKSQRMATRAPLPRTFAGALIGKIGNGKPFGIGSQSTIVAPDSGQLFLGVNDDSPNDNDGEFHVEVRGTSAAPVRR